MKRIAVTGGSGYLGRNLIRELLTRYPEVQVDSISRSEGMISQLMVDCPSEHLNIIMADIRDAGAMHWHLQGVDTVFHLAALKRVDLCETECRQAVVNNVIGTMNVLDAFHGDTFVLMSSDKAIEPVNCYGATKTLAEKMMLERAAKETNGARYMIIRAGNILGSTGSVMDIWKNQIEQNNEITITSRDMVRYYTSVEGVVKLYIAVLEGGESGKIYYTPDGDATIIGDLAKQAITLYGNGETCVKVTGLRPGERLSEKMCLPSERNTVAGFEKSVTLTSRPRVKSRADGKKVGSF